MMFRATFIITVMIVCAGHSDCYRSLFAYFSLYKHSHFSLILNSNLRLDIVLKTPMLWSEIHLRLKRPQSFFMI